MIKITDTDATVGLVVGKETFNVAFCTLPKGCRVNNIVFFRPTPTAPWEAGSIARCWWGSYLEDLYDLHPEALNPAVLPKYYFQNLQPKNKEEDIRAIALNGQDQSGRGV